MDYTLYIVDDEATITEGIQLALRTKYRIRAYSDAETAIAAMEQDPPDLVLLDIGLPGMNGVEALGTIKERFPDILVVMITAYEDVDTVVSAMKKGAHDYIIKPLYMDGLKNTIKNALATIKLRKEVQDLQTRYLQENLPCFVGESRAIINVLEFMDTVARSPDTPVLLVGETGTGKELIASAIHYHSPNFQGPFTTVNCAAIPKDLVESELFGYEKGAFSGADAGGKKGLIEEAAGGTLFLDEIGDLNLEAQAKLLRFLETGEFYRVGGTKKRHITTRVVSATNKDIEEMIGRGAFRVDLYFRLGVVRVAIPSLNERQEDILPLAKHFLVIYEKKFDKHINGLSPEAENALLQHHWTGNVRELKNMIERGVLISKNDRLMPVDLGVDADVLPGLEAATGLPSGFPPLPQGGIDFDQMARAMEKHYIEEAYKMAGGNESLAAKLLNINHHTYRYRRKKLLSEQ